MRLDRKIEINAVKSMSIKPDIVSLVISLEEKYDRYDEAVKGSAEVTNQTQAIFRNLDFHESDIKTLYFNIYTETERRSGDERVLIYKFDHRMKIEFSADDDRLSKILSSFGNVDFHPEIEIEYSVSNLHTYRNELITQCIRAAEKKAKLLAESLGGELGDAVRIDYSFQDENMENNSVHRLGETHESTATFDFYQWNLNPDNIDITEKVTVIWELK